MCSSRTNDRLLGQIECYMDDLVDSFEDFIKKSMIVISIAVGTLVLMMMYILKQMAGSGGITSMDTTYANTECLNKFCQVSFPDLTMNERPVNIQKPSTNTNSPKYELLPNVKPTRTVSSQAIPESDPDFDDDFPKETVCIISGPCENCNKHTQVDDDLKRTRIKHKHKTTAREPSVSKPRTGRVRHPSPSQCSFKGIAKQHSCCSVCCKKTSECKIASPLTG